MVAMLPSKYSRERSMRHSTAVRDSAKLWNCRRNRTTFSRMSFMTPLPALEINPLRALREAFFCRRVCRNTRHALLMMRHYTLNHHFIHRKTAKKQLQCEEKIPYPDRPRSTGKEPHGFVTLI